MACLTQEQLAALALDVDDNEQSLTHVDECTTCRAAFEEMRQLTRRLSTAHAMLGDAHAASRARLLADLPAIQPHARSMNVRNWLVRQLAGLSLRQRVAAGGLGLTTLVGLALLVVALNSVGQLSAMERMAKAIREVKSYSYKLFTQDTFVRKGNTNPSTVVHTGTTYWREPRSLFYDETLVRFEAAVPQSDEERKLLTHLTGIHPSDKPGLFIHHGGTGAPSMEKTYWWVPALPSMRAEDIGHDSPITILRKVREQAGKVLRELGTKDIKGKTARGYVMTLEDVAPHGNLDTFEVWVDPETDLPLEFGQELKDDELTRVFRITDCRWNIEIDPKLFNTTPPEGYEDITPPNDEKNIAEMVAALKLYAELSGGRYPQGPTFDAAAIPEEMLRMAGLADTPRDQLKDEPKFHLIQEARSGLNWIARVLRHKYNAGYYGQTVGPQNREKALLWWMTDLHAFRVFYGDLRTAVLPLAEWAKVVPREVAVSHLPEDGNQSSEDQ